jgi:hypothetical protein
MLPQMIAGIARPAAAKRADELLAMVGLAPRADHRPTVVLTLCQTVANSGCTGGMEYEHNALTHRNRPDHTYGGRGHGDGDVLRRLWRLRSFTISISIC